MMPWWLVALIMWGALATVAGVWLGAAMRHADQRERQAREDRAARASERPPD
jgi:hypothetical protein